MKSRNTFYFDHDYNARNDQKIIKLRGIYNQEGYGLYWCFLETMAEDTHGIIDKEAIGGLSMGYGVPPEKVLDVLEYCVKIELLGKNDAGNYFSRRMLDHKSRMKSFVDFGLKGAEKRWKNSPPNSPPNSPSNANEIKVERKSKEERPPIPPKAGGSLSFPGIPNEVEEEEKEKEKEDDGLFGMFWEMYPRKVGKGAARKAWKKIKEPGLTLDKIETALSWQKKSEQWLKDHGEFIPHPATYLNQERWMDEPQKAPAPAATRAQPMFATGPR